METVNNPRIVTQKFEKSDPGPVGLHGKGFFMGLKVYETSSPGNVCESTPFRGNERRMVAVFPRTYDTGMLI
jgi:hypothetical protein